MKLAVLTTLGLLAAPALADPEAHDVTEKSRRHLEGKMNGGGTAVDLHTTNGSIRLRSRDTANMHAEDPTTDDGKVPKDLKSLKDR